MPASDSRCDVLELPHHGSHHDAAVEFVKRVQPSVVLQSTGWVRWQRDRWADDLAGAQRLVTVRDGACSVRIARDGTITFERFLPEGAHAGGDEIE
jgi:beta-lactamase superfamily II metal-dependent hydrolase